MSARKENEFEEAIEVALTPFRGFEKGGPSTFDAARALVPDEVIAFVTNTQQARWQALVDFHRADAGETLISSLVKGTCLETRPEHSAIGGSLESRSLKASVNSARSKSHLVATHVAYIPLRCEPSFTDASAL